MDSEADNQTIKLHTIPLTQIEEESMSSKIHEKLAHFIKICRGLVRNQVRTVGLRLIKMRF